MSERFTDKAALDYSPIKSRSLTVTPWFYLTLFELSLIVIDTTAVFIHKAGVSESVPQPSANLSLANAEYRLFFGQSDIWHKIHFDPASPQMSQTLDADKADQKP